MSKRCVIIYGSKKMILLLVLAALLSRKQPCWGNSSLESSYHGWRWQPWLASVIDAFIPTSVVAHLGQLSIWLGVPAAALLGSVIYADILLLIPIGFALIQNGASIPIVLTFMIAASGLSLPEMVVLGRILRPQLLVLFVVATLATYVLLGFGFLWV